MDYKSFLLFFLFFSIFDINVLLAFMLLAIMALNLEGNHKSPSVNLEEKRAAQNGRTRNANLNKKINMFKSYYC